MCFKIHSQHTRIKVAEKNITCYKRFNSPHRHYITKGYFQSPYQKFDFEQGECYHEDSMRKYENYFGEFKVDVGLHSYSTKKEGLFRKCRDEVLIKCVIPQGAKYYYNPDYEEYVSDYLIIGTDKDIIK